MAVTAARPRAPIIGTSIPGSPGPIVVMPRWLQTLPRWRSGNATSVVEAVRVICRNGNPVKIEASACLQSRLPVAVEQF